MARGFNPSQFMGWTAFIILLLASGYFLGMMSTANMKSESTMEQEHRLVKTKVIVYNLLLKGIKREQG